MKQILSAARWSWLVNCVLVACGAAAMAGVTGMAGPADGTGTADGTSPADATTASPDAASTNTLSASAASGAADPQRMSDIVHTLAGDDFQGRAPGTAGETRTLAYLTEQFESLGLEPAGEQGGWTQQVPLIRTQLGTARALSYSVDGKSHAIRQGTDIYLSTLRDVEGVAIKNAPLVFVGYGVTAPERQWDDFMRSNRGTSPRVVSTACRSENLA